jgi:hypothetical protein
MLNKEENLKKYWDGLPNKLIRYWFYLLRGLDAFNQFKYLIGAIIALCWMYNLKHPVYVITSFLICIPILIVIGYYYVHYVGKVIEWLGVEFSSHWGRYSFDLQERIAKAVEKLASDKK